MHRWVMLGLLTCFVASPGCTKLTFACADDGECGTDGACEAGGWCSFPDEACPSGRRYAEFSGDGLGGACVEPSSGSSGPSSTATTSAGPGASTTADVSTSGAASSTTVSATTLEPSSGTTGVAESTGDAPGSTSTGSTSSSGSAESTGDPQPGCQGFTDAFDDGIIDPYWSLWGATGMGGHAMSEVDGALRWDFSVGIVEQRGVQRVLEVPFGRVRAHVTETPVVAGNAAQLVLAVREFDSSVAYFMVWSNDALSIRDGMGIEETVEGASWVEARRNADGTLTVSVSADGVTFEPQLTFGNGITAEGVWINLYGQTWTASMQPGAGAVDYVEICEP